MKVIGLGLGRTGTNSLRLALNQLGLGPCHHMEEVIMHQQTMVPLWTAAANGDADWPAIYAGYESADDWPTAAFTRELYKEYPNAKFILTYRSVESWLASFNDTIYKLMNAKSQLPAEMMPWYAMCSSVLAKSGFVLGMDQAALAAAFEAHNSMVKAVIPPSQLLAYQVSEGWKPLCEFLGVAVPSGDFPRSNNRIEFWDNLPPVN